MPEPKVIVRTSKLGRAVYALESIEDETHIAMIAGKIVEVREDFAGSNYCMEFGDDRILEPAAPFRFLNHSCTPNCELVIWMDEDPDDWEMGLHSIRPIRAGEELTIDYGWPADAAIPCECGTENCRGWIVSECETEKLQTETAEPLAR